MIDGRMTRRSKNPSFFIFSRLGIYERGRQGMILQSPTTNHSFFFLLCHYAREVWRCLRRSTRVSPLVLSFWASYLISKLVIPISKEKEKVRRNASCCRCLLFMLLIYAAARTRTAICVRASEGNTPWAYTTGRCQKGAVCL